MATEDSTETGAVAAVEGAIEGAESAARAEGFVEGMEVAQERVDQAQEDAARIAEAALATEIGRRIAALEGNVAWLDGVASVEGVASAGALVSLVMEQGRELAQLRDRLALLETPAEPSPVLIPVSAEPNSSSTPQALAETMEQEADPTEMETPPAAAVVVPVVAPQARERRKVKLL